MQPVEDFQCAFLDGLFLSKLENVADHDGVDDDVPQLEVPIERLASHRNARYVVGIFAHKGFKPPHRELRFEIGKTQIYIQPSRVIRRMTFHETMEALNNIRLSANMSSEFFVVAYQAAAIDEMERRAFSVQAMPPIKDKRARLRVAARYIKNGTVKFPRAGTERLTSQLLGFGIEKHDDAVDALVFLILGVIGDGIEEQRVHYV